MEACDCDEELVETEFRRDRRRLLGSTLSRNWMSTTRYPEPLMVFLQSHSGKSYFYCVSGNEVRSSKAKGEAKAANERATERRDREREDCCKLTHCAGISFSTTTTTTTTFLNERCAGEGKVQQLARCLLVEERETPESLLLVSNNDFTWLCFALLDGEIAERHLRCCFQAGSLLLLELGPASETVVLGGNLTVDGGLDSDSQKKRASRGNKN